MGRSWYRAFMAAIVIMIIVIFFVCVMSCVFEFFSRRATFAYLLHSPFAASGTALRLNLKDCKVRPSIPVKFVAATNHRCRIAVIESVSLVSVYIDVGYLYSSLYWWAAFEGSGTCM